MAQQIADLLEWNAALHHPASHGVPENMGAAHTLLQTATRSGITNCVTDNIQIGCGIKRWSMANKYLAPCSVWTPTLQVLGDRVAGQSWKRDDVDPFALAVYRQCSISPVDIIETQTCHFRAPQAKI